jgi:hypothetical protein
MERGQIDYTKPDAWSVDNLTIIAEDLGYVPDQRFADTLDHFIIKTVKDAKVTSYLLVVAQNHFENVRPPLEKVNSKH